MVKLELDLAVGLTLPSPPIAPNFIFQSWRLLSIQILCFLFIFIEFFVQDVCAIIAYCVIEGLHGLIFRKTRILYHCLFVK